MFQVLLKTENVGTCDLMNPAEVFLSPYVDVISTSSLGSQK